MVSELQDSSLLLPFTGPHVDIFVANSVSVSGQEYYPGLTVLLDFNYEGEPAFAVISCICGDRIYVDKDDVYFVVTEWLTCEFSFSLQAYSCVLGIQQSCRHVSHIADYKPYAAVTCFRSGCTYKHIILHHHLCYDPVYVLPVSIMT